jgi:hypothetical protein
LAAFLAAVPAGLAQNAPHLAYVLPAGGRQGTTFQVKTGGQFLPNVSAVYVSGSGVRATVLDYARPMNAMQATELRDRMQALQKEAMTDAVRKEMVDTRVKLLTFNARRLTSPVLAETVTLQVMIAPGAVPGKRELTGTSHRLAEDARSQANRSGGRLHFANAENHGQLGPVVGDLGGPPTRYPG